MLKDTIIRSPKMQVFFCFFVGKYRILDGFDGLTNLFFLFGSINGRICQYCTNGQVQNYSTLTKLFFWLEIRKIKFYTVNRKI